MVVQGRPGFVRVRTPYVRDEDVARICHGSASLTRDPMTLLAQVSRLAVYSPDSEEPAASQRGEDKSEEAAVREAAEDEEVVA